MPYPVHGRHRFPIEQLHAERPAFGKSIPAGADKGGRWARPKLVGEIEYRGWTADGLPRPSRRRAIIMVVDTMTERDGIEIVPRWEWRTFAACLGAIEDRMATPLRQVAPRTSSEIYVLRLGGPQNAKIRDRVFDIKHLHRVDANGLELWEPVFKAKFPLNRSDLVTAFAELRLPLRKLGRETYTIDQFIDELVAPQPQLRAAHVVKSRQGFRFAGCIAEMVYLSVESLQLESFSLEHEQASCILEALCDLGLPTAPNINYPLALKRVLGLEDDDQDYRRGAAHALRD